jgi:hypothetical protein
LLSAGTEAGQPKTIPNEPVSIAGKSLLADRRDNHGNNNMCISYEHIDPILPLDAPGSPRGTLTFVLVDSELRTLMRNFSVKNNRSWQW